MHYLIARAQVSRSLKRLAREDDGMATAEYAVGTVAVAGLAGLLIKILTSDEARNLIWSLISRALSIFVGG
ncbi:MAG: DUF4244 domain-containing protein [Actinomycetales bacterium]|jgi:Flp pilus assembly pilin Flp|nr:DUF4244 domain-containing protein [Actinomycetales bacterium]